MSLDPNGYVNFVYFESGIGLKTIRIKNGAFEEASIISDGTDRAFELNLSTTPTGKTVATFYQEDWSCCWPAVTKGIVSTYFNGFWDKSIVTNVNSIVKGENPEGIFPD